jgi:hypothetical protein
MMTPRSSASSSTGSFLLICHAASLLMLKVPMRFRSTLLRKSSRLCGPSLVTVRWPMPPPAVVTTMCRPPSASMASLRTFSVPSKSVTSTSWKVPPTASATSLPFDCGRSRIATVAPPLASDSAVALPNPDAPPTTTAFLPAISIWLPFQKVLDS